MQLPSTGNLRNLTDLSLYIFYGTVENLNGNLNQYEPCHNLCVTYNAGLYAEALKIIRSLSIASISKPAEETGK